MRTPHLDRRRFVALAAGAVAMKLPKGRRLQFDIFRNASKVGEQTLRFIEAGDVLTIDNHIELRVAILAVPVFHYAAHIVEHWMNDRFQSATSTIDDNGTPHQLYVERQPAGVMIEGNRTPQYDAPADALPLTYWNKANMHGTIINMQTGKSAVPSIVKPGWFTLPAEPSGTVKAEKYRLTSPTCIGKHPLAVYYDAHGTWTSLAFDHQGQITYRPILRG